MRSARIQRVLDVTRGTELPSAVGALYRAEMWLGVGLLLAGLLCYRLGASEAATAPREYADAGMFLLIPGVFGAGAGALLLALGLSLYAPGRLRWGGHLLALAGFVYLVVDAVVR